ncbi:MAG TPA: hypothetical protein VF212_14930 [Longimicrobiales bacterium]
MDTTRAVRMDVGVRSGAEATRAVEPGAAPGESAPVEVATERQAEGAAEAVSAARGGKARDPARVDASGRGAGSSPLRRLARWWIRGWQAYVASERPEPIVPPEARGHRALPYTRLAGFR